MKKLTRKSAIAFGALAALAAGSAGAVAATSSDEARKRETAVLSDAAKRLDVSPEKLRAALAAAQDAELDQAVEDGKLTQAEADRIKAERKARGTVLGRPGHGPHGGRGFGGRGRFGGGRVTFQAAAKALGLTETQLLSRLRDGDSLNEVAKAEGKDASDVRAAIEKAVDAELDAAVKDGRLTAAQRKEVDAHQDEHLDRLFAEGLPAGRGFGRHGRHGTPSAGAQPPTTTTP